MPGCLVRCSIIFNDPDGKYLTSGIEYETFALMGTNLGIADLDAIAGLTVVSSGTGGAKEIVEHGVSGVIFKSEDDASLARELFQLIQDGKRWRQIAITGQERAMKNFDIEKSVDHIENLYHHLLDNASKVIHSNSAGQAIHRCNH